MGGAATGGGGADCGGAADRGAGCWDAAFMRPEIGMAMVRSDGGAGGEAAAAEVPACERMGRPV